MIGDVLCELAPHDCRNFRLSRLAARNRLHVLKTIHPAEIRINVETGGTVGVGVFFVHVNDLP